MHIPNIYNINITYERRTFYNSQDIILWQVIAPLMERKP